MRYTHLETPECFPLRDAILSHCTFTASGSSVYTRSFAQIRPSNRKCFHQSICNASQPSISQGMVRVATHVIYKNPSSSLCSSQIELISAAVGGRTSSTKIKIAFSGDNLMRLRITYTNWPTVRSAGTKYFFLSIVAMSDFSTFSQITCQCDSNQPLLLHDVDMRDSVERRTGMRSAYFCRIRSASALRFSKGCSSLNFDRIFSILLASMFSCAGLFFPR